MAQRSLAEVTGMSGAPAGKATLGISADLLVRSDPKVHAGGRVATEGLAPSLERAKQGIAKDVVDYALKARRIEPALHRWMRRTGPSDS